LRRYRWLLVIVLLPLLAWFGTACWILLDGLHDELHKADAGIVFASKVERDGTLSARLVSRLDKAVQMYRDGMFPFVIVSGAIGKFGDDEAGAMQTYLVQHGIPAERIYADKTAPNSWLTAQHAAAYMHAHNMQSALVVTQYFHVPRCKLAMRRCGISSVYAAHAEIVEWRDPYFLLREALGFWFYRLRTP
jgi:uncharacterized SAM-binding protein YcdF (DUF218 family)